MTRFPSLWQVVWWGSSQREGWGRVTLVGNTWAATSSRLTCSVSGSLLESDKYEGADELKLYYNGRAGVKVASYIQGLVGNVWRLKSLTQTGGLCIIVQTYFRLTFPARTCHVWISVYKKWLEEPGLLFVRLIIFMLFMLLCRLWNVMRVPGWKICMGLPGSRKCKERLL